MINILHITSNRDGNIGGAEKLLLDLHPKFDPAEFDISYANVLSLGKEDDPYVAAMHRDQLDFVNIIGSSVASLPWVFTKLLKIIRRRRPDIVHTHLLHGSLLGQIAAGIVGIETRILTRHFTNDAIENSRILTLLDRYSLRIAHKVVAVSEAVKRDIEKQSVSADKIEVVHNGIDLRSFDARISEGAAERQNNGFVLGTVGSLTRRKGHEYLISAMPAIARQIPGVKLIIIGDGPEREKLEKLASDLELTNNVEFSGFTNAIPQLVSGIDVYVHAAIFEPFGIALTEAMAAQKCVIAANVGGVPEIVEHNKTGILVKPADADELAKAILWAYRHPEDVRQMGEAGRRRVETYFDLDTIAAKYADIYRSAAGRI